MHRTRVLAAKVNWVWVRIPVVTLVRHLTGIAFLYPGVNEIPVRAEMVLVIDLAWCAIYLAALSVFGQGICSCQLSLFDNFRANYSRTISLSVFHRLARN